MLFVRKSMICLRFAWLPLLFAWMPLQASGQQAATIFPATYQELSQPVENRWSNSWPVVPDNEPDVEASSHRSMSPDTWMTAPIGAGRDDTIRVESSPTPSVPDLKSQSPYSTTGYGKLTALENPKGLAEPIPEKSKTAFFSPSQLQWPSNPEPKSGIALQNPSGRWRYPLGSKSESSISSNGDVSQHSVPIEAQVPNVQAQASGVANPKANHPVGENERSAFDAVEDWYGPSSPQSSPTRYPVSDAYEPPLAPDTNSSKWSGWPPAPPTSPFPNQLSYDGQQPDFRPDLGQRMPDPTVRNFGYYDSGKTYDFEDKKKQNPPLSEILATGRYFASASALYLKPAFQANTAITTFGLGSGQSTPFDFDYESAPMIRFGFESKPGPGIELNYWRYDETSNVANFTSTGAVNGTVSTWMLGPSRWSRLSTVNAGQSLTTSHTIDVDSIGATFFKEVKLPISRINGKFGFQWATVTQTMNATLTDAGGTLGQLNTRSDLRGFGPSFAFEYYRPIGHTKLEIVTTVGGSLLFGHRDQFVQNTLSGDFDRIGADEFLSTADLLTGVQYTKMVAENRGFFARLGLTYQTWMGGGTAVDPEGDFGLRGFSFALGYNR